MLRKEDIEDLRLEGFQLGSLSWKLCAKQMEIRMRSGLLNENSMSSGSTQLAMQSFGQLENLILPKIDGQNSVTGMDFVLECGLDQGSNGEAVVQPSFCLDLAFSDFSNQSSIPVATGISCMSFDGI